MAANGQTSPVFACAMNDASHRNRQPAYLIVHTLSIHPTFTSRQKSLFREYHGLCLQRKLTSANITTICINHYIIIS